MAKNELDEMQDLANKVNATLAQAVSSAEKLGRSFLNNKRDLADLNSLFTQIVESSDDLPDNITDSRDLQREMVKDAKLFAQVQEKTINILDKINRTSWATQIKHLKFVTAEKRKEQKISLEQTEEYQQALKEQETFEQKTLKLVSTRLERLQKEAKLRQEDSLALGNITDLVNDLGNKLKNPNQAFSSILQKAGAFPAKIFEAAKGSKNFGETLKKLASPAMEKMTGYAKTLFSPAGLLIGGVALATAALTTLFKLLTSYWSFLDDKVMPAQAAFNREIGSTSENAKALKSETISAGMQFELLGKSFEEGAAFARDYIGALMDNSKATKQSIQLGKELTLVVGLTAKESGNLVMQFQKQGEGLDKVREMFGAAEKSARSYGLPVNQVLRDLGQFPNILARFGTSNRMEFAKSAAKARSYGLDIGKINDAFGEQLDTFEGSSDAAAKLNAIFGTSINSYELMMETDPTKRMEILRKSLINQGKEWNKLSKFEQNVIASTMGVDKETAALVLSSGKERKELEAKQAAKEKEIKINEKWAKQIGQVKETLMAWGPMLRNLGMKITDFIGRIFGIKSVSGSIEDVTKKIEQIFNKIGNFFDNFETNHPAIFRLLQSLVGIDSPLDASFGSLAGKSAQEVSANDFANEFYSPSRVFSKMFPEKEEKEMSLVPLTPSLPEPTQLKQSQSVKSSNETDFSRPEMQKGLQGVKIEVGDVYLDSRKIGEMHVKVSRRG